VFPSIHDIVKPRASVEPSRLAERLPSHCPLHTSLTMRTSERMLVIKRLHCPRLPKLDFLGLSDYISVRPVFDGGDW
jgi:hypothetical protein